MPRINRIVLVGHCSFDSASLRHAAQQVPRIAAVEGVNDDAGLAKVADDASLLLVNRVLDGRFSVDHGVDLIKQLRDNGNETKAMLISNFPDAQAAAEQAGALPGFGKADTHKPETAKKLAAAVGD